MGDKMELHNYAAFMLRRDIDKSEGAEATGYNRNTYAKRSGNGTLPHDRIERALNYWTAEAASKGVALNLTDALVRMGYLPEPTLMEPPGFTRTATRKEAQPKRDQRPIPDVSDLG